MGRNKKKIEQAAVFFTLGKLHKYPIFFNGLYNCRSLHSFSWVFLNKYIQANSIHVYKYCAYFTPWADRGRGV